MNDMKVAIVHDFLNQYGGAERVLETIKEIFPEADIYTTFFEPEKLPNRMKDWKVNTPNWGGIPIIKKIVKFYTFLLPLVFENFDLKSYDVVISSTASFAKGLILKENQLHFCYCHTPPRFLYHYETGINRRQKSWYRYFLLFLDHYYRIWDYVAAKRVDYFITNSRNTQNRIKKYYHQNAEVIYPGVSINIREKTNNKKEEYYLIVSRLVAYKKIDLVIQACNELHLKLKIIGTGGEEKKLKKISGSTIEFLGQVNDDVLSNYYHACQAVIYPGEDDFGIVPLESMAYGKPVIAYGKGGVLETVVPGKTGEFFYESNIYSLMEVLKSFKAQDYKKEDCEKQARKFSKEEFISKFKAFIEEKRKEKFNA